MNAAPRKRCRDVLVRLSAPIIATLIAAAAAAEPPPSHEQRLLAGKFRYLCAEPGLRPDHSALLGCDAVDDPDFLPEVFSHAQHVCADTAKRCVALATQSGFDKQPPFGRPELKREWDTLSHFSHTIACTRFEQSCKGPGDIARRPDGRLGDVNLLIELAGALEQVGIEVPRRFAVALDAYVTARDLGRDVATAVAAVNIELRRLLQKQYYRCWDEEERPPPADDPVRYTSPANSCSARIDRQWQDRSVDRVLNWHRADSVVTQVTRNQIRRWIEKQTGD